MYVMGIDAGGTKTHCVIADTQGQLLGEGFSGPGNYQVCGIEATVHSLKEAIGQALAQAQLPLDAIENSVFGMSGADDADDFQVLTPAVSGLMGSVPFQIVNDCWIGFFAVEHSGYGIISICGTGSAHAGMAPDGTQVILRNLGYDCGNYGGGSQLVQQALHYAFRSNEATWEHTMLEEALPSLFGLETMDQVCNILKNDRISPDVRRRIPVLVFDLARQGDDICRMLLEDMGRHMGRSAAAVIRRLHLEAAAVPLVLIGGLFQTREPLLIEPYVAAVRETAPRAYPLFPDQPPVMGAIAMALRCKNT